MGCEVCSSFCSRGMSGAFHMKRCDAYIYRCFLFPSSISDKTGKGTFLMCVVFLCITVTHGNDESPLSFGGAQILDTMVGIVIALIINQFPIHRTKDHHICIKY